jgi:hypothetical protein
MEGPRFYVRTAAGCLAHDLTQVVAQTTRERVVSPQTLVGFHTPAPRGPVARPLFSPPARMDRPRRAGSGRPPQSRAEGHSGPSTATRAPLETLGSRYGAAPGVNTAARSSRKLGRLPRRFMPFPTSAGASPVG